MFVFNTYFSLGDRFIRITCLYLPVNTSFIIGFRTRINTASQGTLKLKAFNISYDSCQNGRRKIGSSDDVEIISDQPYVQPTAFPTAAITTPPPCNFAPTNCSTVARELITLNAPFYNPNTSSFINNVMTIGFNWGVTITRTPIPTAYIGTA